MAEAKLRECPFCGSKPIRATRYVYGWKVACHCRAKVAHFNTEAEVIAAWNARTPMETELIEALEAMINVALIGTSEDDKVLEPQFRQARAALAKAGAGKG